MLTLLIALLGVGGIAGSATCNPCRIPSGPRATPYAVSAPVLERPAVVESARRPAARGERTDTLRVAGMTCGGCAIATRKVLARLAGVRKAEVSYERREAIVTYDPGKVTIEQMVAAVKTLGYTATLATK